MLVYDFFIMSEIKVFKYLSLDHLIVYPEKVKPLSNEPNAMAKNIILYMYIFSPAAWMFNETLSYNIVAHRYTYTLETNKTQ